MEKAKDFFADCINSYILYSNLLCNSSARHSMAMDKQQLGKH